MLNNIVILSDKNKNINVEMNDNEFWSFNRGQYFD